MGLALSATVRLLVLAMGMALALSASDDADARPQKGQRGSSTAKKISQKTGSLAAKATPHSLPAPEIEVVLDLRASFLQQVPAYNLEKLDRSQLITAGGKHYRVADHAARALERLALLPGAKLSVVDELPKEQIEEILEAIPCCGDPKTSLRSLVSKTGTYADLESWKLPTEQTLVITGEQSSRAFPGQVVKALPTLFHYDTFEQAQTALEELRKRDAQAAAQKASSFPADEAAWRRHRERMAGAFEVARAAIAGVTPGRSLSGALAQVWQPSSEGLAPENTAGRFDRHIEPGQKRLRRELTWIVVANTVRGCLEKDPAKPASNQTHPTELCLKVLPSELRWTGKKPVSCGRFVVGSRALIASAPLSECLQRLKVVHVFSEVGDEGAEKCGAFTDDLLFIQEADRSHCGRPIVCNPDTGLLRSFTRDASRKPLFKLLKDLSEYRDETLTRRGAFASTLLNDSINRNLIDSIGSACAEFVKGLYQEGKVLDSQVLRKAARPIDGFPFKSGKHAPVFHHYTNADAFVQTLKPGISDRNAAQAILKSEGVYDDMFLFYRTRTTDMYKMWRRVHYLAEDPRSSSYMGRRHLLFHLDPQAKVISWDDNVWRDALRELSDRYPGFGSACGTDLPIVIPDTYRRVNFNSILFVMVEDSEIDLIDFQTREWFQLVRPNSITKTEILN